MTSKEAGKCSGLTCFAAAIRPMSASSSTFIGSSISAIQARVKRGERRPVPLRFGVIFVRETRSRRSRDVRFAQKQANERLSRLVPKAAVSNRSKAALFILLAGSKPIELCRHSCFSIRADTRPSTIAGKFSSSQALSRGADLLTIIGRSIFQADVIHLPSISHRNRP